VVKLQTETGDDAELLQARLNAMLNKSLSFDLIEIDTLANVIARLEARLSKGLTFDGDRKWLRREIEYFFKHF
jgi:hypothetical protein